MNTCVVIVGMFAGTVFMTLHELSNKWVATYPALWSKKLARINLFTVNAAGQSEAPIFMKVVTIEAKCQFVAKTY